MVHRLPCKFQLGAVVYHVMDTDGRAGMVTEIKFCADGGLIYLVAWGGEPVTGHFEIELSTARSFSPPQVGGDQGSSESDSR